MRVSLPKGTNVRKLSAALILTLALLVGLPRAASASGAVLALSQSCTATHQPQVSGSLTNTGPDGTVQSVWGLLVGVPGLALGDKVPHGAVIPVPAHVLAVGHYTAGVQITYGPPIGQRASDPWAIDITPTTCRPVPPASTTTVATEAPTVPTEPSTTIPITETPTTSTLAPPAIVGPPAAPVTPPTEITTTTAPGTVRTVGAPALVELPATGWGGRALVAAIILTVVGLVQVLVTRRRKHRVS